MAKPSKPWVSIIGPAHPYTGGIAQHTTRLALELEAREVRVLVESWKNQYPKFLYKGRPYVEGGKPEIGFPTTVLQKLTWYNPVSWINAGRRARECDRILLNIPTPFHALPYALVFLGCSRKTKKIGLVHNVLPHERSPLDVPLMRWLLSRMDFSIVHGQEEMKIAEEIGVCSSKLRVGALPSPWHSTKTRQNTPPDKGELTALFFGAIRDYKGLDVLIDALAKTSRMKLVVAGEFWGDKEPYVEQIRNLKLESRVEIREGYVPESEFDVLFSSTSLAVLPYKSGTGSFTAKLALSHGVPVIATDSGAVADGVVSGHNGAVVRAGSATDLAAALVMVENSNTLSKWAKNAGLSQDENENLWSAYCAIVLESIE